MSGIAYFEIQADNPESAVKFYRDVFGWHFTKQEGLPIPYWRIETGGIRGGLLNAQLRLRRQNMAPTPLSARWKLIVLMWWQPRSRSMEVWSR